ncbi:MAG: hypothetical protein WBF05_17240, partial [Anaerolineales bacterium]
MKKNLVLITIAGILVLALGVAGFAYAQDEEPTEPEGGFPFMVARWFWARGNMVPGGAASFGRGFQRFGAKGFALKGVPIERMATEMDISVEELESRIEAGESIFEIAKAEGFDMAALRPHKGEKFAEYLDLEPDELQARLGTGETIFEIAAGQGVDLCEKFPFVGEMAADKLGLSPEDLCDRLEAGETIHQIAVDQDVDLWESFPAGSEKLADKLADKLG